MILLLSHTVSVCWLRQDLARATHIYLQKQTNTHWRKQKGAKGTSNIDAIRDGRPDKELN